MDTLAPILAILFYSLVLGIIFAQVLLTTPVIFQVLDESEASKFLRKLFPRYYFLLFLITFLALLVSLLFLGKINFYISLVALAFSFLGYVIIPITNKAKDKGWDNLFKWLHNLSIFNTIIIGLVAVIQIYRFAILS
tara:strand:+ start:817 stop:1227 length:411 start_codon:yes stop_codon:yes gene_type:complete